MKLKKLTLRHFRGQVLLELEPNGQNMTIHARNGIGKTTVADAYSWLLFGKDSLNRAKFDIKYAPGGVVVHGLNHTVEGVFDINGKELELMRTYRETYEGSRGAKDKVYTGHTTDYFVNTVPQAEKNYTDRVNDICPEQLFMLLGNPEYFPKVMKWQDRRSLLLKLAGDVTDADVIASNKELKDLTAILDGKTTDELRLIASSKLKAIAEELGKIPERIDENRRNMPTVESDEQPGDVSALRTDLTALQTKKQSILNSGAIAEKTTRIKTIAGLLVDIKTKLSQEANGALDLINADLRAKNRELNDSLSSIERLERIIATKTEQINEKAELRKALRTDYLNIDGRLFEFGDNVTCSLCSQELPAGRVAEIREKAEKDFNTKKSDDLTRVRTQGVSAKEAQELLESEVQKHKADLQGLEEQKAKLENEQRELNLKASNFTIKEIDLSENKEAITLVAEQETLQAEIVELQEGKTTEVEAIEKDIQRIQLKITFAEKVALVNTQRENTEKRIAELEEKQQELAKQREEFQRQVFLTELFIKTKVKALTEKINSKFERVTFRLFDDLVNGGLVECCEALWEGRPYTTALSTAERINAGLDIINTLAEHFEFAPPIIIDGAESVNEFIQTKGQQIRLRVSDTDTTLRVELEGAF